LSEKNSNLILLERMAKKCLTLLDEMVFVGGSVVNLYRDSSDMLEEFRPTYDVDVVVKADSLMEYHEFEKRVKTLGFSNCIEKGAPICRYISDDLRLDLMPDKEDVLGFSNP
jgi:hypothetical protein